MMRKEIIFVIAFLAILVVPAVSATTTEINIKTISGHRAGISVLDSSQTYKLLEGKFVDTGDTGDVIMSHTSDAPKLDIIVKITKDGDEVLRHKFEEVSAGETQYFLVYPGKIVEDYMDLDEFKPQPVANESEAEANETTEEADVSEESGNSSALTGKVFGNLSDINISSSMYYIIGGIVLAIVIVYFVFKIGGSTLGRIPTYFASRPSTNVSIKPDEEDFEEELADAEKKIREAQEEIGKLRGKEKIVEAEKKLERDKRRLEALRRGDDRTKLDQWENKN